MCFIQMLQICLLCVNKNFLLTYLLTYLCFIRVSYFSDTHRYRIVVLAAGQSRLLVSLCAIIYTRDNNSVLYETVTHKYLTSAGQR